MLEFGEDSRDLHHGIKKMGRKGEEQVKRREGKDDIGIKVKPRAHPDGKTGGDITNNQHDWEKER